MKQNAGKIIALVIVLGCFGAMIPLFSQSKVNYVPFREALAATDSSVQVMGAPVQGTMFYNEPTHTLHFVLDDGKGVTLPVVYKGPKPEDLDSAAAKGTKIGAVGSYDRATQAFVAESLLVKCPSKYQGSGTTDRQYTSKS